MFKIARVGLGVALCLVLAAGLLPVSQAATSPIISVSVFNTNGTCLGTRFLVNWGWTSVTDDDGSGHDLIGLIATDANGNPIQADFSGGSLALGFAWTDNSAFGAGRGINPIAARPITIQLLDIGAPLPTESYNTLALYNALVARGAPVLGQLDYDPVTDIPDCASLPLVLPPEPPEPEEESEPVPGPDMVPIPNWAVVGQFVTTTPAYYAPLAAAATPHTLQAGKTVWVYGVDASGGFYKVMLSGKFFWVPVSTIGPNPDEVWKNTPLPTQVAE